MRHSLTHSIAIVFAVIMVMSGTSAQADDNGIVGRSVQGCGGCHGANATPGLNVQVQQPNGIRTGDVANFNVVVAQGNMASAGINLAIRNGQNQNAGQLIPGDATQVMDGELTHVAPVPMVGGAANFPFVWGVPAQHGIYTLTLAACAVNGINGADPNDQWRVLNAINLTVRGATITSPAGNATYCKGDAMNIAWTQTGYATFRVELTVNEGATWDVIAPTVNANANALVWNIPQTQQGSAGCRIRLVNVVNNEVAGESASFAISTSPTILIQPEDVSVCVGNTFSLSVGVDGVNNQYRWRKGGQIIPGAYGTSYTVVRATESDGGTYDVQVFGCGETISRTVTVKILERPVITQQPTSVQVCQGQTAILSVQATGDTLRYQWYKNGEAIPDRTAPTLSFDLASIFDDAAYYCIVTGACTPARTSDTVRLTVIEPPKLNGWSSNKDLFEGDSLTLAVQAVGKNLLYQWRKDGRDIVGAIGATYRIANVALADSGVYRCHVRNACDSLATRDIIVKVRPASGPGFLVLGTEEIDLGTIAVCDVKDTMIVGLLRNRGGSSVSVTSISTDPPGVVTPFNVGIPLEIPAGSTYDVLLRIRPRTEGDLRATISIFSPQGRLDVRVKATVVAGVQFVRDTVLFVPMVDQQAPRCNWLQTVTCDTITITNVRLSGAGASTYRLTSPQSLPVTLVKGQGYELCLDAVGPSGGTATVTLESDAGSDAFIVARDIAADVDDDIALVASIAPNPTTGDVTITAPMGATSYRIANMHGAVIVERRIDERRSTWDGRIASGVDASPGVYQVLFDGPQGRTSMPLVIVR